MIDTIRWIGVPWKSGLECVRCARPLQTEEIEMNITGNLNPGMGDEADLHVEMTAKCECGATFVDHHNNVKGLLI